MKTTLKLLLFASVIFTATSCATVLSSRTYNAFFYTETLNTSLRINDSENQSIPSIIELERSRRSLNVQVLQEDSIVNNALICSQVRVGTIIGNLFSFSFPGIIIDATTSRVFTYGRYFFVDSLGEITSLRRPTQNMRNAMPPAGLLMQHQQGNFNLQIALPYINFFYLNPQNETPRNFGGFVGFGLGLEYFYKNNRSIQLRGDVIDDFSFFLPYPMGSPEREFIPYPCETATSFNLSLTDNLHINRFRFGYGLNFARNILNRGEYDEIISWEDRKFIRIPGRRSTNNMLGLALSAHYRLGNSFHIGVIYRPSFFELSRHDFMYEHTISIDFMWKINL